MPCRAYYNYLRQLFLDFSEQPKALGGQIWVFTELLTSEIPKIDELCRKPNNN